MDESPISNPFDNDDKDINRNTLDDQYTSGRPLVWALLGVVVIGCGVFLIAAFLYFQPDTKALYAQYFPSPTSTPSRTPTPTPTNTPTPTPNFTATALAIQATGTALAYQATLENAENNWKVIVSDTFDSNSNDWLVHSNDDEYALRTYEISDGKYRWDVTAHKSFIGWVRTEQSAPNDFYLSTDIRQIEGPANADYGLIFREDAGGNFYYFGVTDRGHYILLLYFEEWKTLIDWTETELVRPGESNRLAVLGEGSHFTFFINDKYLADIVDDTIPAGSTALAIELADENDHAILEFDNFDLRAP